jgi:zona occludens toxin (predicted ATPase)
MYDLLWELTVKPITFLWLKSWGTFGSNKPSAQKFNVERFNLRKLRDLEVRKQYQIKVLNDSEDLNRV